MRHLRSVSNIILLITLLTLGVVVAFFAPNKNVHENPTNSAPASNTITVAPSAPPVLPTLPPTGPSPTPEDPNARHPEVPILTPRVIVPVTIPTPVPSDPYEVTVNRERGIFYPKEITKMSEVIVVATVRKVMPARWTSADGRRPINPHAPDNAHSIYRPVLIDIELPIKGVLNKQSLILLAWGGVVGNDSAKVAADNLYTFNQGDRVVVFLNKNKQGNNLNNEPLWDVIEHYNIDGQDNANNEYQNIPLKQLLDDIRSAL
jgi:hypothetical protein